MAGRLICRMGGLIATLGILELGNGSVLAQSWPSEFFTQAQMPISLTPQPTGSTWILAQDLARPTLRLGSVGDAVSELQAILKLLGYYQGPVDGFYREPTQAAVGQFQIAVGIASDGVVGPTTWQKLLPTPGDVPIADIPEPVTPVAAVAPPEPATPSAAPTPPAAAAPTPPATPTPAPATRPPAANAQPVAVDLPVLRQGMFGPAVTRLQERLATLGTYKGPIDGVFGSQTAAAVEQVQRQHELTVDGVVGPVTWSVIFK